jgi:hypothetical protein
MRLKNNYPFHIAYCSSRFVVCSTLLYRLLGTRALDEAISRLGFLFGDELRGSREGGTCRFSTALHSSGFGVQLGIRKLKEQNLGVSGFIGRRLELVEGESIEEGAKKMGFYAYNKDAAGRLCSQFEAARQRFQALVRSLDSSTRVPEKIPQRRRFHVVNEFISTLP